MTTSTARKLGFIVFGILLFMLGFLANAGHGSGNGPYWSSGPVIVSVIALMALGFFRTPVLWFIFFVAFSPFFLDLGARLAHSGMHPSLSFVLIIFAAVLPVVILLTWFFGIYEYPMSGMNEITLALMLLALPLSFAFLAFVHGKAMQNYFGNKKINFILAKSFSSIEQCRTRHVDDSGFCYGYFAAQKNNINLCRDYISKNVKPSLDSNYIEMNCVAGFSVYTNNWSVCNTIQDQGFRAKCVFHFAVAKKDFKVCDAISYKPFEDFSFSKDKCLEYNPAWYVKMYSEIMGSPE
jgi:hypothetical protein